jgi:hypothetical protein
LSKVLVFNPYFRISLEECFEHPLFAQIRIKEKENMPVTPVNLQFEKEELNRDKLRQLILNECSFSGKY